MSQKDIYDIVEEKFDKKWKRAKLLIDADRFKTYDEVFDHQNLDHIYKLMTRGDIDRLICPISTGKEANVYRASTKKGEEVAVKIFRTSTSTFKSFLQYIDGDRRFKRIDRSHRGVINTWARKEFMNLDAFYNKKIYVPKPRACFRNIIVMDYIDYEGKPAPQIRVLDAEMGEWEEMWADVLKMVRVAYTKCGLIHSDLSEYNILYNGSPVYIDMGQSVDKRHPHAEEFLRRDLNVITHFFEKKGLKGVKKQADALFDELTHEDEE